jgi:hypothetical protein
VRLGELFEELPCAVLEVNYYLRKYGGRGVSLKAGAWEEGFE